MLSTIRINAVGDLVKVAQYLTGYAKLGEATDFFDEAFENYIKAWQREHGLEADGVIGPRTWSAIAETLPTCSTSKNKTSAYTCAIQILVGGLETDGIYGKKTKNAVAAYQAANGLAADGICGPKTWAKLIGKSAGTSTGGGTATPSTATTTPTTTVSGGKVINKCVHYLQWDKRWKSVKYSTHTSEQTIGNSGCGPSSMAMIMATFIDPKITPVEMCALAVAKGYRTYDEGTSWKFFPYVADHYEGFSQYLNTDSIPTLKAALAQGALAVCSMNGNDGHFWTTQGFGNGSAKTR